MKSHGISTRRFTSIAGAALTSIVALSLTVAGYVANAAVQHSTLHVRTRPVSDGSGVTVLYRFRRLPDGQIPSTGLIADATGALYGTTASGGAHNRGTVYKLTPSGSGYSESVLYSFKGGKDGAYPVGSLVADAAGTLYGTTAYGGSLSCASASGVGCGIAFALAPARSGYVKHTLYEFKGYPTDGSYPGSLIIDASGNLYGTTTYGGSALCSEAEGPGCGTVFRLSPSGAGYVAYAHYQESALYSFKRKRDGLYPSDGLLMDASGSLYGTTSFGGSADAGSVFKLTPSGNGYAENSLYSFKGAPDGSYPNGSLVMDRAGSLYGTTLNGGTGCDVGCGTVFALRPSGSAYVESILHDFEGTSNGNDGADPDGGLLAGKGGVLYGSTSLGGSQRCRQAGCGTVYELAPSGSSYTETVLYAFRRANGYMPSGTLLADRRGRLYGTAGYGGLKWGTVFRVNP